MYNIPQLCCVFSLATCMKQIEPNKYFTARHKMEMESNRDT